jgi:hypothetical protein
MNKKNIVLIFVAIGIGYLSVPQAQAFQNGEGCELKQTKDGFVALRKGPSAKSKLIYKLANYFRVFPTTRNNTWVYVEAAIPEASGVPPRLDWSGAGYVKSSLIDWSTCNNAG